MVGGPPTYTRVGRSGFGLKSCSVLFDKELFIVTSRCGNGFVVVLKMKEKKRTLILKKYILKYLLMRRYVVEDQVK